MEQASGQRFTGLSDHYRIAAELGFPAFVRSIDDSTPINATPYVVGRTDFFAEHLPPAKCVLRDALGSALDAMPGIGLAPDILLIGGSFLVPDATPKDLDCVIFYSREEPSAVNLPRWQEQWRHRGLDMRLIPIGMDPVMVLKSALFFGALYAIDRARPGHSRGVVLVDCAK